MSAQWSPNRWPKKAVPPVVVPAPPPPPPPPLHPVDEKWMARFGTKQFYFVAAGLKAAESRAEAFFRTKFDIELTWLGVVPC